MKIMIDFYQYCQVVILSIAFVQSMDIMLLILMNSQMEERMSGEKKEKPHLTGNEKAALGKTCQQ
jgi:hypothetical protein